MSSLINQVTPLTRGIIWLVSDEIKPNTKVYGEIDYLLDGLLTANLNTEVDFSSRVLMGNNFDQPLWVMVIREIKTQELQSFASLFKSEFGPGNDIIVIDESHSLAKIKTDLKGIASNLKVLQ